MTYIVSLINIFNISVYSNNTLCQHSMLVNVGEIFKDYLSIKIALDVKSSS